jgi:hypothetical protein
MTALLVGCSLLEEGSIWAGQTPGRAIIASRGHLRIRSMNTVLFA